MVWLVYCCLAFAASYQHKFGLMLEAWIIPRHYSKCISRPTDRGSLPWCAMWNWLKLQLYRWQLSFHILGNVIRLWTQKWFQVYLRLQQNHLWSALSLLQARTCKNCVKWGSTNFKWKVQSPQPWTFGLILWNSNGFVPYFKRSNLLKVFWMIQVFCKNVSCNCIRWLYQKHNGHT